MRHMVVVVPELTGYGSIRRISVSLPYAAATHRRGEIHAARGREAARRRDRAPPPAGAARAVAALPGVCGFSDGSSHHLCCLSRLFRPRRRLLFRPRRRPVRWAGRGRLRWSRRRPICRAGRWIVRRSWRGMYAGPDGGLYAGPGGGLYAGPGGGIYEGPPSNDGYKGPWSPCITGVKGDDWTAQNCPR